MASTLTQRPAMSAVHSLHAMFAAGTVPLFLGALLSDWAYANTYEIQWNNFASWLLAGGLVFVGAALLFALVDLLRGRPTRRQAGIEVLLLVLLFVVGLLDALMHARDAWAGMPDGLLMSAAVFILACLCTWLAFRSPGSIGVTP